MAGTAYTLRILALLDLSRWTSGLATMSKNAATVGSVLNTTVGAGALAVAGGMFKAANAAADWQDEFAGVKRTIDVTGMSLDEQDKAFTQLNDDLREVAKTTPITHEEIADMAKTAGALGIPTAFIDDYSKFAGIISRLSDDITPTVAAMAMGRVRTIFGMRDEDIDNFASSLVTLGQNGASTEGQILAMAQMAGGTMANLGAQVPDVLAYSAAFSNVGVMAEAGGSAIQRMFQNAGTAIATGSEALTNFANLAGMTREQFTAAFEDDPAKAIEATIIGLSKLDKIAAMQGLKSIGINQARWTRGWMSVINAQREADATSGDLEEQLMLSRRGWEDEGYAMEVANKRFDTFNMSAQKLMNKLYDLGITIGNALLPIMMSVVDWIGPIIDGFNNLLQSVPGVTAVLAPLIAALSAIVAIRFGARLLTLLLPMGPLGAILANSWTGIVDAGILGPVGKRLLGLKAIVASAITTSMTGASATAAATAGGTSIAGAIIAGIAARFRVSPRGTLLGGALVLGGEVIKGMDADNAVNQMAGSLMTMAGAFMVGGPIGLAAGALYETLMAFGHFNDRIQKATDFVEQQTASALSTQTDAELQATLQRLKGMPGQLGFIGDAIYAASDITQGTIFSGPFGSVAETNERQIAAIEAELERRKKGLSSAAGAPKTDEEWRQWLQDQADQIDTGGAGIVKSLRDIGNAVSAAWDAVSEKFDPPKNMGFHARLNKLRGEMRQAWRGLAKAVKDNDPINAPVWYDRIKSVRRAIHLMRTDGVANMSQYRKELRGHAERVGGSLKGIGKDAQKGKTKVERAITAEAGTVKTKINSIKNIVASVDLSASGAHMVQTLISGINSMLPAAIAAGLRVAKALSVPLHFSRPPQVGPLKDIRSWAPHMVREWLKPFDAQLTTVRATATRLGGAIVPQPHFQPAYATTAGGARGLGMRGARGEVHFHIGTLVADDRGLDQLDRRMEKRRRLRRRHRWDANSPD